MRNVTVYRVDYTRKTRVPIGFVVERRRTERGNNLFGLLNLARKAFSRDPREALSIAVDIREASNA